MTIRIYPYQAKNLYETDLRMIKTLKGQEAAERFQQKYPTPEAYADAMGWIICTPAPSQEEG